MRGKTGVGAAFDFSPHSLPLTSGSSGLGLFCELGVLGPELFKLCLHDGELIEVTVACFQPELQLFDGGDQVALAGVGFRLSLMGQKRLALHGISLCLQFVEPVIVREAT